VGARYRGPLNGAKPRLPARAELLPLSLSQLQQLRLAHPLAELALWVAAVAALDAAIAVPHRRALAADARGGAVSSTLKSRLRPIFPDLACGLDLW
jgi:hypothetical protein